MGHLIRSKLGMKVFLPVLLFNPTAAGGLFNGLSNLALVSLLVLLVTRRLSISFNLEMSSFVCYSGCNSNRSMIDKSLLSRLAVGLVFDFAAGPPVAASLVAVASVSDLRRLLLVATSFVELGLHGWCQCYYTLSSHLR